MKLRSSFFYTIRENIKDEESISGNLLVRSGMIKKSETESICICRSVLKSLIILKK